MKKKKKEKKSCGPHSFDRFEVCAQHQQKNQICEIFVKMIKFFFVFIIIFEPWRSMADNAVGAKRTKYEK